MDRVAVFVDAGYLFAQGSLELCGQKLRRGELSLDHGAAIAALKNFAEAKSGLPLLRVYWYDGTSQGPSAQHIALAYLADVKIRLGFVNPYGQQKGVDSLIVTDMLTLARNQGMAECVLLSGDEDLRVGVQLAQEHGVRVHLLGIKPARGSQSMFLLQEADATYEWTVSDLDGFLKCNLGTELEPPTESVPPELEDSGDVGSVLKTIAEQVAADVPDGEIVSLFDNIRATNMRPKEIDAQLLAKSRRLLGSNLDASQKNMVREGFLHALQSRLNEDQESVN